MSCSIKYNCCQQPGLCPNNKICEPFNSPTKPWKRFTCKCRDGYHGKNCDQPIRSCAGYLNVRRKSGKYKVVDSQSSTYEAYCHFDSDAAWTLVQSYSNGNRSLEQFKKPLFNDAFINEDNPTWSGYRLSKSRMRSINDNSTFLLFTCDYEKTNFDLKTSDFLEISFRRIHYKSNIVDVLELRGVTSLFSVAKGHGRIGKYSLSYCHMWLYQSYKIPLLVGFLKHDSDNPTCTLNELPCTWRNYDFFSNYDSSECGKRIHRCINNANSTTQLWFGTHKPRTVIRAHPAN